MVSAEASTHDRSNDPDRDLLAKFTSNETLHSRVSRLLGQYSDDATRAAVRTILAEYPETSSAEFVNCMIGATSGRGGGFECELIWQAAAVDGLVVKAGTRLAIDSSLEPIVEACCAFAKHIERDDGITFRPERYRQITVIANRSKEAIDDLRLVCNESLPAEVTPAELEAFYAEGWPYIYDPSDSRYFSQPAGAEPVTHLGPLGFIATMLVSNAPSIWEADGEREFRREIAKLDSYPSIDNQGALFVNLACMPEEFRTPLQGYVVGATKAGEVMTDITWSLSCLQRGLAEVDDVERAARLKLVGILVNPPNGRYEEGRYLVRDLSMLTPDERNAYLEPYDGTPEGAARVRKEMDHREGIQEDIAYITRHFGEGSFREGELKRVSLRDTLPPELRPIRKLMFQRLAEKKHGLGASQIDVITPILDIMHELYDEVVPLLHGFNADFVPASFWNYLRICAGDRENSIEFMRQTRPLGNVDFCTTWQTLWKCYFIGSGSEMGSVESAVNRIVTANRLYRVATDQVDNIYGYIETPRRLEQVEAVNAGSQEVAYDLRVICAIPEGEAHCSPEQLNRYYDEGGFAFIYDVRDTHWFANSGSLRRETRRGLQFKYTLPPASEVKREIAGWGRRPEMAKTDSIAETLSSVPDTVRAAALRLVQTAVDQGDSRWPLDICLDSLNKAAKTRTKLVVAYNDHVVAMIDALRGLDGDTRETAVDLFRKVMRLPPTAYEDFVPLFESMGSAGDADVELQFLRIRVQVEGKLYPEKDLEVVERAFANPGGRHPEVASEASRERAFRLYRAAVDRRDRYVDHDRDALKREFAELREQQLWNQNPDEYLIQYMVLSDMACRRVYGKSPYNTQGVNLAIISDEERLRERWTGGRDARASVATIGTGDGKTILAMLLAGARNLQGIPIAVSTSNDYLAERDCGNGQHFFDIIGCSAGVFEYGKTDSLAVDRLPGIIYAQEYALRFEALRCCLLGTSLFDGKRRGEFVGDEMDVLFGDRRTQSGRISVPGQPVVPLQWIPKFQQFAKERSGRDILLDLNGAAEEFCRENEELGSALEEIPSIYIRYELAAAVRTARMEEDVDFVKGGHEGKQWVAPVDLGVTARVHRDSRWSDSVHSHLAYRNGATADVRADFSAASMNTVRFSELFDRLYLMSGSTGTAAEKRWMARTYGAVFYDSPPHVERKVKADGYAVYRTQAERDQALLEGVASLRQSSGPASIQTRPILTQSPTIRLAKKVDGMFREAGYRPQLFTGHANLNQNGEPFDTTTESEEGMVAEAGKPGSITNSTDVSGRGSDMIVEDDSDGGMKAYLLGVTSGERPFIQLTGRVARHGQEGSWEVIACIEDDPFLSRLPDPVREVLIEMVADPEYGPKSQEVRNTVAFLQLCESAINECASDLVLIKDDILWTAQEHFFSTITSCTDSVNELYPLTPQKRVEFLRYFAGAMQGQWGVVFDLLNKELQEAEFSTREDHFRHGQTGSDSDVRVTSAEEHLVFALEDCFIVTPDDIAGAQPGEFNHYILRIARHYYANLRYLRDLTQNIDQESAMGRVDEAKGKLDMVSIHAISDAIRHIGQQQQQQREAFRRQFRGFQ